MKKWCTRAPWNSLVNVSSNCAQYSLCVGYHFAKFSLVDFRNGSQGTGHKPLPFQSCLLISYQWGTPWPNVLRPRAVIKHKRFIVPRGNQQFVNVGDLELLLQSIGDFRVLEKSSELCFTRGWSSLMLADVFTIELGNGLERRFLLRLIGPTLVAATHCYTQKNEGNCPWDTIDNLHRASRWELGKTCSSN